MKDYFIVACVLIGVAIGCAQDTDTPARTQLAAALRDSLGSAADPQVGFLVHRRHLLVHLDSKSFEGASDSTFAAQAKELAQFSLRHYKNAAVLDSITVESRQVITRGQAMIQKQSQAFAITQLTGNAR